MLSFESSGLNIGTIVIQLVDFYYEFVRNFKALQ